MTPGTYVMSPTAERQGGNLFGHIIRARREQLGKTQREVGDYANSAISRLESGASSPTLDSIEILSRELELDPVDLFLAAIGIDPYSDRATILVSQPDELEIIRLYRRAIPAVRRVLLAGLREASGTSTTAP